MCFVSIHLAENHYYDKLRYERNAFQPLWRESHPQTPISLIVFKVFAVHFKQHMSQTFMSSAEILFTGQQEGFFALQHWQSENTSVVWGRACSSSPNRKNEKRRKAPCICQTCSKRAPCTPQSASFIPFGRVRGQVWCGGEKQPFNCSSAAADWGAKADTVCHFISILLVSGHTVSTKRSSWSLMKRLLFRLTS